MATIGIATKRIRGEQALTVDLRGGLEAPTPLPKGEVTVTNPITRDELKGLIDRGQPVTIVEALPEEYYRKAHLPGALLLPHDQVDALAPTLLPDKTANIVVYCANLPCPNSVIAAERLSELGYVHVREYAEGKQDWLDAGYPVDKRVRALV
jgi:rhodanese-related sulfurtransferase